MCMFWVQRSKGHDCVQTLAYNRFLLRSPETSQPTVLMILTCEATLAHTHFESSLLPQSQTDRGAFQVVRSNRVKLIAAPKM